MSDQEELEALRLEVAALRRENYHLRKPLDEWIDQNVTEMSEEIQLLSDVEENELRVITMRAFIAGMTHVKINRAII